MRPDPFSRDPKGSASRDAHGTPSPIPRRTASTMGDPRDPKASASRRDLPCPEQVTQPLVTNTHPMAVSCPMCEPRERTAGNIRPAAAVPHKEASTGHAVVGLEQHRGDLGHRLRLRRPLRNALDLPLTPDAIFLTTSGAGLDHPTGEPAGARIGFLPSPVPRTFVPTSGAFFARTSPQP